LDFSNLKLRIKNNEGYSNKAYKDQLGFLTIGYGHLIKSNESKYLKNFYSKKYLENLFDDDFNKALVKYNKLFFKKNHGQKEKELLIEMLFQLGDKGVSKFVKMLSHIEKKQKFMTCLEMLNSLWYKQTPKRVEDLIKNYINN
tara:strand:- start:470 stop:898 length:429 start_codon:yes stop_codon:yes gene_type:complete